MSATLFSRTPRRDSSRPHRVARVEISNEPQGDGFVPPPPSKGEWLCDEPYKYDLKSLKNPLALCNEVVERYDEDLCKQLKEEINFLMVVAGLFLAIVAAFTVESYKFLQEDKQDTMSDLLFEVVRLLNDTNARGHAKMPKPFTPNHHDIVVNQLWFLSMILSLIAVGIGTFCLQWISAFSRASDLAEKSVPAHKSLALRQLRYEGIVAWGVLHAPEALLLLVQLSIGLFTSGLIYFLWNISHRTTIPALVAASLAGALLYLMNLFPYLQSIAGAFIPVTLTVPHCPYKSPTSWLILNTGNVLPYILKLLLKSFQWNWVDAIGRPGIWLKNLPLPFTDFRWKKHDLVSVRSREAWEDSWTCAGSRLHYFSLGLSSALDDLIYDPKAKDIVASCLQDIQPIIISARDWTMFSQQDLSNDEKSFLDNEYRLVSSLLPPRLDSATLQLEHANRIRVDFLNALIMQHLTQRNAKLDRILFHHRVELYIRVKNSTQFIVCGDDTGKDFGSSLECPLDNASDVGELDLELKFQFLNCVKHLIDIHRFTDLDIMSAAAIVLIEGPSSTPPQADIQDLVEFRRTDSPAPDGIYADHGSAENVAIKNLETKPGPEPGRASLPNGYEKDRSEFVARGTTTEDTQLRPSLPGLCSQVQKLLCQLGPSDFQDVNYYKELRDLFQLPAIFPPEHDLPSKIEEV